MHSYRPPISRRITYHVVHTTLDARHGDFNAVPVCLRAPSRRTPHGRQGTRKGQYPGYGPDDATQHGVHRLGISSNKDYHEEEKDWDKAKET